MISVADMQGMPRTSRGRPAGAFASLDRGLLVRADDEVALPAQLLRSLVQVQNRDGPFQESTTPTTAASALVALSCAAGRRRRTAKHGADDPDADRNVECKSERAQRTHGVDQRHLHAMNPTSTTFRTSMVPKIPRVPEPERSARPARRR